MGSLRELQVVGQPLCISQLRNRCFRCGQQFLQQRGFQGRLQADPGLNAQPLLERAIRLCLKAEHCRCLSKRQDRAMGDLTCGVAIDDRRPGRWVVLSRQGAQG